MILCQSSRRSDRRSCRPFRSLRSHLVIRMATAGHKIDHIVGIVAIAAVDNAADYHTQTTLTAVIVEIVVLVELIFAQHQAD